MSEDKEIIIRVDLLNTKPDREMGTPEADLLNTKPDREMGTPVADLLNTKPDREMATPEADLLNTKPDREMGTPEADLLNTKPDREMGTPVADLLNTKPDREMGSLVVSINETCPQKGFNPAFNQDDLHTTDKFDLAMFPCKQPSSSRTVKCPSQVHPTPSKCSSLIKYMAYVSIIYNNVLGFGVSYSLGILYVYLIEEFNTSRTETAMITSTCTATLGCGGIFAGMLYRKIGIGWSLILATALCSIGLFASSFAPNIWFLFFSLGILFGSGAAINNIVSFAVLEKLFHNDVHVLSIILTICAPIGSLCVPLLLDFFLNLYSWRGALMIFAGFSLNMCFSGLLSYLHKNPNSRPKSKTKVQQHKIFDVAILKNKLFLIISTAASINTCCGSLCMLLVVDFWVGKERPMIEAISLISFVSIASLSSRLAFGCFSFFFNTSPILIYIFYTFCGISGLFFILAPTCNTYAPIAILIIVNGFSRGMLSTLRPLVFKQVVGVEAYPLAIGFTFTVNGICTMPAAAISGKITDLTHSYDAAFYLIGLFEILMFFMLVSLHILIVCLRKKNHKIKPENLTSHNAPGLKPPKEKGTI